MASSTSVIGPNSGFQVGQNHGHITAQFQQSETSSQASLDQACLRDLRATNPYDDKERIKSTNGGLFRDSYRWILDNKEFKQWQDSHGDRLLWIRGDPGKGKTMLLCGIIEELTRMNQHNTATISFFFCQATDIRINNATAVLRGLIYSIVIKRPSLLVHVRGRYDQAGKALFEDINAWTALSAILKDILEDQALESAYIVIDALDECTNGLSSLLDLIVQGSSIHQRVKWIVSSRNWPEIIERLDSTQISPISLELNEAYVFEAVNRFIQHKVDDLANIKNYSDETRDKVNDHLLSNSQGTFLWVALVCQELSKTLQWNTLKKLEAFPPGLSALYGRMVDRVLDSENAEICVQLLALVSIVYRPITIDELCMLIEMPSIIGQDHKALSGMIAMCGSFLALRQNTIIFVHQSAKEFLLQEAPDKIFPGSINAKHHMIFMRSLSSMFQILQRDICNIKVSGFPATQVQRPAPHPLGATRYACTYWVEHLQASGCYQTLGISLSDGGYVDRFLQQKYLQWLEALSILGSISNGIQAMKKLEILLREKSESEKSESRCLLHRARDASRFIQYHRTSIEGSPLQVYYSPLIFSPRESLTRVSFQHERPNWVLNDPMVVENWSLCLQTFEGHSDDITLIAWSPDGSLLASVSTDKTVKVWDEATGQSVSTLREYRIGFKTIAWSPDGSRLALAAYDITKIWDATTGEFISTLTAYKHGFTSIAWPPDGSLLASSGDTGRIWDPATGETILILEHIGSVFAIAWSPDGNRLVSAAADHIVRLWDSATRQIISILEHDHSVSAIAWSPDENRLALATGYNIRVWNPTTGQITFILEHDDRVLAITWSPDGTRLASLSSGIGTTFTIWNPTTGQRMSTSEGHGRPLKSIAWSPDGNRVASASINNTVKIWDPTTGQTSLILENTGSVLAIAWSPGGSRLASASKNAIRIWDMTTRHSISSIEEYENPVSVISWSQDGSLVASASLDNIKIWNPVTGQVVLNLEDYAGFVYSMAWSQDGSQLASSSYGFIKVWDLATGQSISTFGVHIRASSIAWSPDGSQLASVSLNKIVTIWNPATGERMFTFEGHGERVESITWSQDGSHLASASRNTVRVWNPATGQTFAIFEEIKAVTAMAWSHEGSRLALASRDTVRIWDSVTGQLASTLLIRSPSFLEFDTVDFNMLHTSTGTFDLGSLGFSTTSSYFPTLPDQRGYGLNHDKSWITYNGVNMLWLPVEYRLAYLYPSSTFPAKLVIGCSRGRCIFLILAERNGIADP